MKEMKKHGLWRRPDLKNRKKPDWMLYVWNHRFYLSLALILSLLITGAFVFEKYLAMGEKFVDGFTSPIELTEAAATLKDDGENLEEMLSAYIWGSIYLAIPVFCSLYWMFRMGLPVRRKKGSSLLLHIAGHLATILLALGCFVLILFRGQETILDIPLAYLSRNTFTYERWFLAWLLAALIRTDWRKTLLWSKKAERIHAWFLKLLAAALTAFACFAIVELSCESKMAVFLYMEFFSLLYWVILFLFFCLLTRRVRLSCYILLGAAEFIGLGNYIVMQFRGTYVMSGDLTVIGTALEVAGNYTLVFDKWFFIPIAVLVCAVVSVHFLTLKEGKTVKQKKQQKKSLRKAGQQKPKKTPEQKREGKIRLAKTVFGELILIAVVVWGLYEGFLYGGIKGNTWNYTTEVKEKGYMPFFFSNMMATNHITLEGYSAEQAEAAIRAGAEAYDATHDAREQVQEPNIIVIQNEAFADLSVIYDYELSEDCMPFIHSLTENTQKGYVNASVTGGPTANTEFEFLTRYSLAYLPTGSIPFAQYVKTLTPSILTVLKNQEIPYNTIGFHPYHASGYNRESVYQTLGFDEAVFYEDTTGRDRIRKLLSDRADYDDVIEMYETNQRTSDHPLFVFNVTIQNHSPFTYLNDKLDSTLTVTSFEASKGINNYFTLIRESDAAFEELVEYFSGIDDPTIILMYGDHQPSWDDDSKKIWEERQITDEDNQKTLNKYYIPYIMWANFDIDEYDGLKYGDNEGELNQVSMNYLSARLLEAAGVELSEYDKYLLNLNGTVPAVSSKGYWDSEGNWYKSTDTGELADPLSEYNQICYNLLFDRKNHLWDLFGGTAQLSE